MVRRLGRISTGVPQYKTFLKSPSVGFFEEGFLRCFCLEQGLELLVYVGGGFVVYALQKQTYRRC
mgnify:CR=1 FL=1|jgi:hypothetical protein